MKKFNNFELSTKLEIETWLKKHSITCYTIEPNLVVNVNQDVLLAHQGLTHLPVKFGEVKGKFNIIQNQLTNFKNCPDTIEDDFLFSYNQISSFQLAPKKVGGNMFASVNHITELFDLHTEFLGLFYHCVFSQEEFLLGFESFYTPYSASSFFNYSTSLNYEKIKAVQEKHCFEKNLTNKTKEKQIKI